MLTFNHICESDSDLSHSRELGAHEWVSHTIGRTRDKKLQKYIHDHPGGEENNVSDYRLSD